MPAKATSAKASTALASLVRVLMLLALIGPAVVLAGVIGLTFGLLDYGLGLETMILHFGRLATLAGVGLGVVIVLLALLRRRRALILGIITLAITGLSALGVERLRLERAEHPPVHQVSTDWSDPPGFSDAMIARRRGAPNRVEADPRVPDDLDAVVRGPVPGGWAAYGGRRVAEINAETCAQAQAVPRQLHPDQVAAALRSEGITVVGRAPWRVEGFIQSPVLGFTEDVVVRIRPGRTDVRVIRREGLGDGGASCRRAAAIITALGAYAIS